MTAQRIPSIIFQSFYPGNNLPLNGGKVWTYKAGTTGDGNLQTTWSDANQNAENTNPVTLDANGKANIFGGSNAYHIVVYDKDGNLIDDQDYVFFGTPNQVQTTVASLADLRALPFGVYQFVVTEYRSIQADGGGGEWDWSPDSSSTDDGILVVSPNSLPDTGRWIRRYAGKIDCRWGGVVDNAQSINDNLALLFTAVGNRTVWFPHSPEGSGQYASTESFSFPADSSIDVDDGAFFSIDTATTFNMAAVVGLTHGASRLFIVTGTLILPKTVEVQPEWFDAVGDGTTDNHEAIATMLASLPAAIYWGSENSYATSVDPDFGSSSIGLMRANGNVWNFADHSIIYLAKGIKALTVQANTISLSGWVSYNPTVSVGGGGSFSEVSHNFAYNISVGGTILIQFFISGTISGTVNQIIFSAPPIAGLTGIQSFPGVVSMISETSKLALITASGSAQFVASSLTPAANFTTGSTEISGNNTFLRL